MYQGFGLNTGRDKSKHEMQRGEAHYGLRGLSFTAATLKKVNDGIVFIDGSVAAHCGVVVKFCSTATDGAAWIVRPDGTLTPLQSDDTGRNIKYRLSPDDVHRPAGRARSGDRLQLTLDLELGIISLALIAIVVWLAMR